MQKRRTKPRVAWLPHTDANTILFPDNTGSNVIDFALDAGGLIGTTVTGVVPVVIDDKQDPEAATTSLSDIENSGYRLRRIVGKCFVAYQQDSTATAPKQVLVACAFIILRVDENSSNIPLNTNLDNYNLFKIKNDDSPWIWRREWILQNGAQVTAANSNDYPFTNAEYGSNSDGPHIDQKTARTIMSDERLFFVASAMALANGAEQEVNPVNIVLTTRVLASMRTTLGNRRNASR